MAGSAIRSFSQFLQSFFPAQCPPPYVAPPTSNQKLEYADLVVIDLANAKTPAGRKDLATQVVKAMSTQGFFYAINHGYTHQQTTRIFGIANLTFDGVNEEEKKTYTGQSGAVYEGYKPRQTWNRDVRKHDHPPPLRPYLQEIQVFAHHNHFNILYPILRLLALGLELPEETLVEQHKFEAAGESSVRFMKYYPRSEDEEQRTNQVWLKGHTDIGSVTILWSQPIGGLQILSPDGSWRWVRHMENAVVINAGDVLTFLCGGFYPATRHRVIQPPADQAGLPRLGVFYFSMANDDVKLIPHAESPVLRRVGIERLCRDEDAPTMEEWRKNRTIAYGSSYLVPGQEKGTEEEIIRGVLVKHYN
ncbi:hypothetical protein DFH06DRAFT_1239967 [Mycena polygramma]|nr:hypothetical protein DFH06DRAFT_1239967 [Mycena polygramma]